ncbi:hypothetical protein D3C84_1255540 [compost metagenome]
MPQIVLGQGVVIRAVATITRHGQVMSEYVGVSIYAFERQGHQEAAFVDFLWEPARHVR